MGSLVARHKLSAHYFAHVRLRNGNTFPGVDVKLPLRVFQVGPQASGKSNFLDVFRFLRGLAAPGNGLQRGGRGRAWGRRREPQLISTLKLGIEISVTIASKENGQHPILSGNIRWPSTRAPIARS